jgi:VIT1/CCC1 family predicted Fe2+/Mn2+ transporter
MSWLRAKVNLPFARDRFESLLSGAEAGIATTAAIVVGLAVTTNSSGIVLLSAGITLFIQAFNAAGGRYSSLRTSQEISGSENFQLHTRLFTSFIQLVSHLATGMLVIIPVARYGTSTRGIWTTLLLSTLLLTLVAIYKNIYIRKHVFQDTIELILVGVLVMLVGLNAGLTLELILQLRA